MKQIRFNKYCQDKYTEVYYNNGDIAEFEDARADEIVNSGCADYVVNVLEHAQELHTKANNEENTEDKEQDEKAPETPVMVDLDQLSKKELIEIAKENNVATRGTKEDIIARLMELAD